MLGNRKFPTALSFSCPHSRPRSISWSLDYTTFSLSDVTRVSFLLYIHPRNAGHFLFDIDNRVEIQKLNQVAAELPPGWVFGVQLGLWQIQALIKIKTDIKGKTKKNNYLVPDFIFFRGWNAGKNSDFSYLLIESS